MWSGRIYQGNLFWRPGPLWIEYLTTGRLAFFWKEIKGTLTKNKVENTEKAIYTGVTQGFGPMQWWKKKQYICTHKNYIVLLFIIKYLPPKGLILIGGQNMFR